MFSFRKILEICSNYQNLNRKEESLDIIIIFRLELQKRLPWLEIQEKPISDSTSTTTEAVNQSTT